MSFVLADQKGWLKPDTSPFEHVVLGTFESLRNGLNSEDKADFFMWEYFTTKKFYDNGELKHVGDIWTPWASWVIAATNATSPDRIADLTDKLDNAVSYYLEHEDEAVQYITSAMEYSVADAKAWQKTVQFSSRTNGVELKFIEDTISILQKAGVLPQAQSLAEKVITIRK